MSGSDVPTDGTADDPWESDNSGPDLSARRRKTFDSEGRAVRPEPGSNRADEIDQGSPGPDAADPANDAGWGAPTEAPWEADGPPEWNAAGAAPQEAPEWAQPAPPAPATGAAPDGSGFPNFPSSPPPTGTGPLYPGAQNPAGQFGQPIPQAPNYQAPVYPPPGQWGGPAAPPAAGGWAPTPQGHVPFYQPGVGYYGAYPETSQASTSAWLSGIGLASMLVCALGIFLCPVGWYIANAELKAIKAGRRDPKNEGTARAGQIMGIIGTVLMVLGIAGFAFLIAVG